MLKVKNQIVNNNNPAGFYPTGFSCVRYSIANIILFNFDSLPDIDFIWIGNAIDTS